MIKRIDHLGIVTDSIERSSRIYQSLGLQPGRLEEVGDQKVKVLFFQVGESRIELLEPTHPDSPISRFLRKRGEGLHHIALKVDNLELTLQELKQQGFRLVDEQPREGAEGKRIAFLHPQSTGGVLLELCEDKEGNMS
jgi:methylmalonyl-CoA/ethylmalonyl-CoA epimerase